MSKVQRPRLGRGLSSLIQVSDLPVEVAVAPSIESLPSSDDSTNTKANQPPTGEIAAAATDGDILQIPIAAVHPNPHQPRQSLDPAKISELAASIKSTGLIQPIIVRKVGDGYQLIAGERRWRAAQQAGLESIPAIVREVSSFEQAQMALVENIQREDLNPIDRAQSYRALMDQLGLTQAELANRLGEERSSIANYLRLLELVEPVRAMVREGALSMGHAKLIAGVEDPLEQQRLAGLVRSQELSVRNLERVIVERPTAPDTRPAASNISAHFADLEKSISRQLGLRVQVRGGGKKGRGRLVIHYATLDDFDALMSRLSVSVDE